MHCCKNNSPCWSRSENFVDTAADPLSHLEPGFQPYSSLSRPLAWTAKSAVGVQHSRTSSCLQSQHVPATDIRPSICTCFPLASDMRDSDSLPYESLSCHVTIPADQSSEASTRQNTAPRTDTHFDNPRRPQSFIDTLSIAIAYSAKHLPLAIPGFHATRLRMWLSYAASVTCASTHLPPCPYSFPFWSCPPDYPLPQSSSGTFCAHPLTPPPLLSFPIDPPSGMAAINSTVWVQPTKMRGALPFRAGYEGGGVGWDVLYEYHGDEGLDGGMGWDGMGWDEMRWDGRGWDGMRWDGMR
eukprot:767611-Hanusia_phi.AAC.1